VATTGITPPCKAIPFAIEAIVNSATPACKKPPEKSPFFKADDFFKNPSVLSLLDKSAEETIIFSTCSAKYPNTLEEATLVAKPSLWVTASKFKSGNLPERKRSNLVARPSFALLHALISDFLTAASAFFLSKIPL